MRPYYDHDGITIYHGDCRDVLPTLCPADLVLTDPPYGENKAEWDGAFPTDWLPMAAQVANQAIAIMPGISNLLTLPRDIPPFSYRWMLSIHLSNGMTRGYLGFGNWIPVAVYGRQGVSLYRPQQDATTVPIVGVMPDHPSPKPLLAMKWLIGRFKAESVIDPFMGSGTTLAAAKLLGRRCIGIDISEEYCAIAVERLRQGVLPLEVSP